MLLYSVIIHLCLATSFVIVNAFRISFRRLPPVVYRVQYIELGETAKPSRKVAKLTPAKREEPKVKPQPKPQPKTPKPEPKPTVEKKPVVAPPKKAEVAKVVKPAEPKKEAPEIKTQPAPSKQETPPPPPPEPEPMQVAKAAEPPSEPDDPNTVDINADGGPTSSNISPELRWYIERIRRKVWQNWIVPMHALPPGTHARVVIRFEIERDGNVTSTPQVLESSSISLLDQSGYGAVVRAAPFPPLPEGFRGDKLGVRFGFEYGEEA